MLRSPHMLSTLPSGLIIEVSTLRDDSEQRGGGAARAVHSGLPLADRLLACAQLIGYLLLGEPQVPP